MTYMPFRLFLEELRFFYLEYTESSGGQHIAYFVFIASARSSVFLLSRPRIEMIIFASGLVEFVAVTICIKCLLIIFQLVEISYRAILLTMKSECLSNVYLYLFHNRFLLLATCTSGLSSKTDLAYKNRYNNRETGIRTRRNKQGLVNLYHIARSEKSVLSSAFIYHHHDRHAPFTC